MIVTPKTEIGDTVAHCEYLGHLFAAANDRAKPGINEMIRTALEFHSAWDGAQVAASFLYRFTPFEYDGFDT